MSAVVVSALVLVGCGGGTTTISRSTPQTPSVSFPLGTATPSEVCGQCHVAIYAQAAFGTGTDLKFRPIILKSLSDPLLPIPGPFFDTASAHHLAGVDPWPIGARNLETAGAHCNTCHYPEPFNLPDLVLDQVMHEPTPRPVEQQDVGITCASCHLTPDGKIRGKYDPSQLLAPHASVLDPNFPTSVTCAFCHAKGPRVVGTTSRTHLNSAAVLPVLMEAAHTLVLNSTAPLGPLTSMYHLPAIGLAVDVREHWTWKAGWNYYNYNEGSAPGPTAPRDFRGNVVTVSLRYSK